MRNNLPMRNDSLMEWIKAIGVEKAITSLFESGLSISTSVKIATGHYRSKKFRDKSIDAIKLAMQKDGFSFGDEKAS